MCVFFFKPGPKQDCLTETYFHDAFQRYENKQFEPRNKAHLDEIKEEAVFFYFQKAIRPLAGKSENRVSIKRHCSFGAHSYSREKRFLYLCTYICGFNDEAPPKIRIPPIAMVPNQTK